MNLSHHHQLFAWIYVWKPADHLRPRANIWHIDTVKTPLTQAFSHWILISFYVASIAHFYRSNRGSSENRARFYSTIAFRMHLAQLSSWCREQKKVSRLIRYLNFFLWFPPHSLGRVMCATRMKVEKTSGETCLRALPWRQTAAAVSSPVGISFHMLIALLLCFHSHSRVFHFFTVHCNENTALGYRSRVYTQHRVKQLRLVPLSSSSPPPRFDLKFIRPSGSPTIELRNLFFPASRRRSAFISSLILLHNNFSPRNDRRWSFSFCVQCRSLRLRKKWNLTSTDESNSKTQQEYNVSCMKNSFSLWHSRRLSKKPT